MLGKVGLASLNQEDLIALLANIISIFLFVD